MFRFFKMAAAAILNFRNFSFLMVETVRRVELNCIIVQNFVETARTAAEIWHLFDFYPRRYASAGISPDRVSVWGCVCECVCVCVCLSVTRRYCTKTAKRRITQTAPRDNTAALVFSRQQLLVGDPFPLKFALKVTHPLSKTTISTNICS